MKRRLYLFPAFAVALLSVSLFSSCEEGGDYSEGSAASSKKEQVVKEYSRSDLENISKKVEAYKEEIGFENTAEYDLLAKKSFVDYEKMLDLKKNHPVIKEIEEDGWDAKNNLMQATATDDEEGKEKWGEIVGAQGTDRINALKEIPEIIELQKEMDADEKKMQKLEYEQLSKTPKGKQLAERHRAILEGFQDKYR